MDKALNCAIHAQKHWSRAESPGELRICLTAVDLASVLAGSEPKAQAPCARPWVGRHAEKNKEAIIKAGPSRAKVVLRDFREEVVSPEKLACGNEPWEAEYLTREEGMKQATE